MHMSIICLLNHEETFLAVAAEVARARELWPEGLETSDGLWLAHTAAVAVSSSLLLAGLGPWLGGALLPAGLEAWQGGLEAWLGALEAWLGAQVALPGALVALPSELVPSQISAHAVRAGAVGPPAQTACACLCPCPSRSARPCQESCAKCQNTFFCACYCAEAGFIAAVELVRLPQPQAYLEGCGTWQLYPKYKYSCKATYKESPSDTPLPLRFRF